MRSSSNLFFQRHINKLTLCGSGRPDLTSFAEKKDRQRPSDLYPEILIFDAMPMTNEAKGIRMENTWVRSRFLNREVDVDFYLPPAEIVTGEVSLLLINDGQDMEKMHLDILLQKLYSAGAINPVLCCAIHASSERRMEYGTQNSADYKDRGNKAGLYTSFIMEELLPYIHSRYKQYTFHDKAYAGFSLGGLSALDIVWNNPAEFSKAGLFSSSFWWRSLDQNDPAYDDEKHRIMHQQVRNGQFAPGLKFFFQCGKLDETRDRNKNGIIDSIDDTLDLIRELEAKGYSRQKDITYLELPDGRHDVFTWGRAMPEFLRWAYGNKAPRTEDLGSK